MNNVLIESCNGYLYESGYFSIPLLEADGDEKKEGIITRFKNWIKKIYEYIKEKVVLLWKKIKRKLTGDIGNMKRLFVIRQGTSDKRSFTAEIYAGINEYLNKIEKTFNEYESMSKKLFSNNTVIADSDEDKYLDSFKEMNNQYEELKELLNGKMDKFLILTKKDLADYEKFLNQTDKLIYRSEKIVKDLSNHANEINDNSNVKVLTDGISGLVKSVNRLVSVLNRDVISRSLSYLRKGDGLIFTKDGETKGFNDGEE